MLGMRLMYRCKVGGVGSVGLDGRHMQCYREHTHTHTHAMKLQTYNQWRNKRV